jgi:hypothetical protein
MLRKRGVGYYDFETFKNGSVWPHEQDAANAVLCGSPSVVDGVRFTRDQYDALNRWAGEVEPSTNLLAQAKDDVNLGRIVKQNGLRVMAVFASHLEPGEDPVEVLLQMMRDLGWDVPYMVDDEDD